MPQPNKKIEDDIAKKTPQTPSSNDFSFPIDYSAPNKDMGYSNEMMKDYTSILPDELEGKTRKSEEIGFDQLGEVYPEDLEEDSPLTKSDSVQQFQEMKPTAVKQPPKKPTMQEPKPTSVNAPLSNSQTTKVPPAKSASGNVPLSKSQTIKVPPAKQNVQVNQTPVKAEPVRQETQVTAPKAEEKRTPQQQQNDIFKKISELRDEINKTGKTWTDSKEFRKFRDALNKSADAIAKRKPGEPTMKPEEMDKMLKDISTAADNYYFAKLGQSHNARRNLRFDIAAQTRDFMQQAREGLQQENKPIEFNDNAIARSANKLADKIFYAKSEQNNKALLQGEDHTEFFRQSRDFAKNDTTFRWMMSDNNPQFLEFISRDSKEVSAAYQGQDTIRKQVELNKQAKASAPEQKKETAPAPKTQTSPDKDALYQQLVEKMTGALFNSSEEDTKLFFQRAGGVENFQKALANDLKTAYQGKDTPEFLQARISGDSTRLVMDFTTIHKAKRNAKQNQNPNPTVNKNITKQSGYVKE